MAAMQNTMPPTTQFIPIDIQILKEFIMRMVGVFPRAIINGR